MRISRRSLLAAGGAWAAGATWQRIAQAGQVGGTIQEFERDLWAARREKYHHPKIDIVGRGFRPVGGAVADFGVAEHDGRVHFFYIERRLQEGTPFYPGHEIYFGHASTANLFDWEVHEPVMLIRPGTWEGAHVWAPCIVRRGGEFIMAYTGVNRHMSQDIGLASSRDLFEWTRWESNPISPCRNSDWADWREDRISSCRDPHLFEHDGQWWLSYTANTKEGASCVALARTRDFKTWHDCGPICIGPADGYEMRVDGGHPQGSLESAHILRRRGRWHMLVKAKVRDADQANWIITSDRHDRFDFAARREFWPEGFGIEVVRDRGDRTLLATFFDGHIRFGTVDWRADTPTARLIASADELREWQ
ncbi:MAG TPA: hypothetical protein PLL65_14795 [Phycisphaerae bacterium]|nr:hypothetical protein [Phycisphaerae bacterium]